MIRDGVKLRTNWLKKKNKLKLNEIKLKQDSNHNLNFKFLIFDF